MTNSGAGDDFQRPSAHPEPERELKILAAPNVQTGIVLAEIVEVVPEKEKSEKLQKKLRDDNCLEQNSGLFSKVKRQCLLHSLLVPAP